MPPSSQQLRVIDSHTEGEPTRVVVDGLPELGRGSAAEMRSRLREEHDWVRTSLIHEPRGSDVMVGAALFPPADASCVAGVVFFNNAGYLNMCGHGAMGVVATLGHLGRIEPGVHRLETPVGIVTTTLHADRRISIENVPSYRFRKAVPVASAGVGQVHGDIAWGGNWFFLCEDHGQRLGLSNVSRLTEFCWAIREALNKQGITGEDGGEIDHIELTEAADPPADAKNFVLCPGRAYDRSPCGTGTSAKLACLAADGRLAEGETWRQRSIVGGIFEAVYRRAGERIIPTITGRAFVNAEATLLFDPDDPFRFGIAGVQASACLSNGHLE